MERLISDVVDLDAGQMMTEEEALTLAYGDSADISQAVDERDIWNRILGGMTIDQQGVFPFAVDLNSQTGL